MGRSRMCVGGDNAPAAAADIGLRCDEIFEARQLRDAELQAPGVIDAAIYERVEWGREVAKIDWMQSRGRRRENLTWKRGNLTLVTFEGKEKRIMYRYRLLLATAFVGLLTGCMQSQVDRNICPEGSHAELANPLDPGSVVCVPDEKTT
ncbi:MAG: hypothetical protein R3D84_15510 [Paracoccaceae bacterium]